MDWCTISAGVAFGEKTANSCINSTTTTTCVSALWPTQSPIQGIACALSPGLKWLGCESDHSPPPSAELSIRHHGVVLH
jgi:hypothetical protein